MPIDILMPALSPTMTEGNLAKWLKKEGDVITPGMVIAEIETDKATMEVEAVDGGILGKIVVAEGAQGVAVNALLAIILEEGESADSLVNYQAVAPTAPKAMGTAAEPARAVSQAPIATGDRVKASPLARRIAEQEGVSLAQIQGSGPAGRIVKDDVLAAKQKNGAAKPTQFSATEPTHVPHSMMRKVIAKRLMESKQTIPHFYLSIDCNLDALLAMRKEMNDAADSKAPEYKLSVNDFIIKASAMALTKAPEANASWTDEAMIIYSSVDISVAVAIPGGLITPIIRNANLKSIATISNEMKDLAARAKEGKLKPEEFQGGGFSISNLGMFGIKQFQAIVNPPQSCILAVGAGEERPVVKNGVLAVANVMSVSLSCDHRVVDGAVAAEFLAAFKRYIESPATMLV